MLDEARESVVQQYGDNTVAAQSAMEHEAVKVSLSNLRTFSCIREREADGRLMLHGAWFSIDQGVLHLLDETTGAFSAA
jgi:carbonic anhydrase